MGTIVVLLIGYCDIGVHVKGLNLSYTAKLCKPILIPTLCTIDSAGRVFVCPPAYKTYFLPVLLKIFALKCCRSFPRPGCDLSAKYNEITLLRICFFGINLNTYTRASNFLT